ncbi:MAG: hypothetical protein OEY38_18825 [Gammaproteobacteria bacterium]|nr:hypothetical protein [Gammaproteobacteria bacterium]
MESTIILQRFAEMFLCKGKREMLAQCARLRPRVEASLRVVNNSMFVVLNIFRAKSVNL